MALTFVTLQNHVTDIVDVDDATTLARVKDYINITGRDVWMAHEWPERFADATLALVAPYSTGTVSSSGSTITGSGTTFPAATAAGLARFAASYSSPWYVVTTRDSATQLTLADSYIDTALSGSTYVLYQDVYEVASTVDTIVDVRLLKANDAGPLAPYLERRMDEEVFIPGQAGTPQAYSMVSPNATTGVKRIRIWPVPNAVYRLRYRYLKSYTDMSGDSDECVVPESRRDLLICGTLRYAWRLKGEYQKAAVEDAAFARMLNEHWQREKAHHPVPARLRRFDQVARPVDPFDSTTLGVPV